MILTKDILTKATRKGRLEAVSILNDIARLGGYPTPLYEFSASGSPKRPRHHCKVRFQVPPQIVSSMGEFGPDFLRGAGRCTNKKDAKSYAAHEVVLMLEECLALNRNGIPKFLDDLKQKEEKVQQELEATPIEQAIPNVTWDSFPFDPQFQEANRRGRLDFVENLRQDADAFQTAKDLTLLSRGSLPEVEYHHNHVKGTGQLQKYCNIRISGYHSNMGANVRREVGRVKQEILPDLTEIDTLQHTLHKMRHSVKSATIGRGFNEASSSPSFGMAKLFMTWPKHHLYPLKKTIAQLETPLSPSKASNANTNNQQRKRRATPRGQSLTMQELEDQRKALLKSFRSHQKAYSLPIDQIESEIPADAPITILKGGTGSGKTTRYPLMLSLVQPQELTSTTPKIIVAQPRRLACQAAARHVASLLDKKTGGNDCPIGYAIRFESMPARGERTIDFCTPGVLLRRATEDPFLQDVTHLIIDEVHTRNADTDLLLSLAKQAVQRRANTNSPLKLILMSATLESASWERYFEDIAGPEDVAVVNVPDYRRFPIDILHHGDEEFPTLKYFEPNESYLNDDDALCKMTAQLALKLAREEEQKQNDIGGSILCFLPGMEEIRLVHRCIRDMLGRDEKFRVQYLHSSLTSQQQGKVFEKGLKIILSTNIAETSLTIPDVKAVIDTGRERQHSLLESTSCDNFTTVVGSQLATVNISRAAAEQRAGRAGRVSAGTCYRLYSRYEFKTVLEEHTSPEMLRMELSQLVLHSLSLYHPSAGHDPLQLLQDAPDRPDASRLEQTLRSLAAQSLILYDGANHESTQLTPLGEVVSSIPATPLLGRMLMIGLVLQSIEPAITIASLLSVPKVFMDRKVYKHNSSSSDIIKSMEDFYHFRSMNSKGQRNHPQERVFRQVQLVALQLEGHMRDFLARATAESEGGRSQHESKQYDWDGDWNANSQRIGAVVSLICCATPHIAHLVQGRHGFATRDISGSARIHNSSINFDKDRRVHWYAYKELRATKQPYLHVTTAVSPLEVALFSEASTDNTIDEWLFLIDQWVPVDLTTSSQKNMFVKLRSLLMNVLPQHITENPSSFLANADAKQLVLLVLSAIEQQRIKK